MTVCLSLLLAISGLFKVYRSTQAFSGHAKSYRRMLLALQLSKKRLCEALNRSDLDKALAVFKELGLMTLAERGNWLRMHRDRPVLVQRFA
jgi:hypothetical protein